MPVMIKKDPEHPARIEGRSVAASLRCERCAEPIRADVGGTVAWEPDDRVPFLEVVFLHGSCAEGYARDRDVELESAELDAFVDALLHNLREPPGGGSPSTA